MDLAQTKRAHQQILKSGATLDDTQIHSIPTHVQEWANPAASDDDGWVTSIATVNGANPLVINGAHAGLTLSPPRNVICVLNSHADHDAGTATITGTDITGAVMTEDITIPNNGNTTVVGVKCFATVTAIAHPTSSGTNGTIKYGSGSTIGLNRKLKTRQGGSCVVYEINANARVSCAEASYASATVSPPYGAYIPATTVPNATRDYCLAYEVDMT